MKRKEKSRAGLDDARSGSGKCRYRVSNLKINSSADPHDYLLEDLFEEGICPFWKGAYVVVSILVSDVQ